MMNQQSQQSATDINHWQNMMLNFTHNICGIFTVFIEMGLRPQYGSTYFPPIIQLCAAGLMVVLPVLGGLWEGVSHMVPFMGASASMGLFGMGTLSKLFFLGSFIHGFRVWRRMTHMESEKFSYFEGPALPIFRIVPGSFWIVRIVYEPVFVFVSAIVLENFFILQPGAAHFLMLSAVMLAMKEYTAWYMQWQVLRELMDMRNVGPIIAKVVDNSATEDELATVHLASIPKDIPEDLRRETATHIARAFTGADIPGENQ
jgi:hypothetical protein